MPVDFLSDEQVARYRRFRPEVSVAELEQFFRLDAKALEALAGKRRPAPKLASAVETIAAFVPTTDDDAAAQWRAELVKRYRTVQGFIELLLEVIRFRAVEAGTAVLAMVRTAAAMAKNRRRYTRST